MPETTPQTITRPSADTVRSIGSRILAIITPILLVGAGATTALAESPRPPHAVTLNNAEYTIQPNAVAQLGTDDIFIFGERPAPWWLAKATSEMCSSNDAVDIQSIWRLINSNPNTLTRAMVYNQILLENLRHPIGLHFIDSRSQYPDRSVGAVTPNLLQQILRI
jgi:hypothetical protein